MKSLIITDMRDNSHELNMASSFIENIGEAVKRLSVTSF
jgi:hypothetical protein